MCAALTDGARSDMLLAAIFEFCAAMSSPTVSFTSIFSAPPEPHFVLAHGSHATYELQKEAFEDVVIEFLHDHNSAVRVFWQVAVPRSRLKMKEFTANKRELARMIRVDSCAHPQA